MKVLNELTAGKLHEVDFLRPRSFVQTVNDEPVPGFFRKISIGPAGVMVAHGEAAVLFPLQELIRLAVAVEPGLAPATPTASKTGGK